MNTLVMKLPFKVGNVGIPMQYVDKQSLFEAMNAYESSKQSDDAMAFENKPLENQFVVRSVDPFNETAEIFISQELYQKLASNVVLGSLCLSYLCDMTPVVTAPLWRVNAIKEEFLSVTVQAHVVDFLYEEEQPCQE